MHYSRGQLAALVGWTDNQAQNALRTGRVPTAAWGVVGSEGDLQDVPEPRDSPIAFGKRPGQRVWARFDQEQVLAVAAANVATGAFWGCGENARLASLIARFLRSEGARAFDKTPPTDLYLAIVECDHEAVAAAFPSNPDPLNCRISDFANCSMWIAQERHNAGLVRAELIDLAKIVKDVRSRAAAAGLRFPG